MKYLFLTALLMAPTQAFAEWNQIDDVTEMKRFVVGKAYESADKLSWFQFNKNGSIEGGYKKAKLSGKWKWQGKFACTFNRKLGGKKQGDSCVVVRVDGRALETIRDKGKGRTSKYRRR